jgi:hypothetical protein
MTEFKAQNIAELKKFKEGRAIVLGVILKVNKERQIFISYGKEIIFF